MTNKLGMFCRLIQSPRGKMTRYGQHVMNCLASVDYDLYESIVDTDLDCFYATDKGPVDSLIQYVTEKWQ